MTICNAALCDEGNAIILVADKMIGMSYIESELEITKMRPLHKEWWMMFAGDDISHVFDIVDYAKDRLEQNNSVSVGEVQEAVSAAFAQKRIELAQARYLTPIAWDISRFSREGNSLLPDFADLKAKISDFSLGLQLLTAGFDRYGKGHVFSVCGYGENRGIPRRSDIPGFDSIGSGSTASMYMMFYRDLSSKTPAREAVYFALEAKYFGEQATGVGACTDLFLARHGKDLLQMSDEVIEEKLIPICYRLSPNRLQKRDRDTLNGIKELSDLPEIEEPTKRRRAKPQKTQKPLITTGNATKPVVPTMQ